MTQLNVDDLRNALVLMNAAMIPVSQRLIVDALMVKFDRVIQETIANLVPPTNVTVPQEPPSQPS